MSERNEPLSERELEILRLVATGAANKEIARQLVISPNTVKVHLRNIFTKIGVASRTEATLYALQIGLVKAGAVQPAADEEGEVEIFPAQATSAPAAQPVNETAPVRVPGASRMLRRIIWPIGLIVVLALALISASVFGTRLLSTPTPAASKVAANAATPRAAPTLQRWTQKASLPAARKGMGITEYEDRFYLVAGETSAGIDGAVLRYDPGSNTWESLASKPTPVTDVQAALLAEKIYIPGGRLSDGHSTDHLEVYDPRENTWKSKAPLPEPVSGYALASFEGQLYLFGGMNDDKVLSSVYVYSPQTDQWTSRTAMSTPRAFAGAAVMSGKIYVLGGFDGQHALTLNQAYFPARDASGEAAWEDYAPMPTARYGMGTTSLAGIIYLVGGVMEKNTTTPEKASAAQYVLQSNAWGNVDGLPPDVGSRAALLTSGNYIYIFGGETKKGLSAANLSYQAIFTINLPIMGNNGNQ